MTLATKAPYTEPDMAVIRANVEAWATENGFCGPYQIDGPEREEFPKYGHGYTTKVRELNGKHRMATARYTHEGKRSFWQMDGMITG